jgi:ABC-2 type transport system permease protein
MTAPVSIAPPIRSTAPLRAQTIAEIRMTLKRGESLLLAIGIPVMLLVFFSLVKVLPSTTTKPVDFLAPGVLALAIMSTAMVSTAIATGFERRYGVLKRIGTTPLGRTNLLIAKIIAVLMIELIQVVVLVIVGALLGWRPPLSGLTLSIPAVLLGTAAFAGLGLAMAGSWRAELTLAGANGIYLVLLLISGMVIPLAKLPGPVRAVAQLLPSSALSDVFHGLLTTGGHVPARAWIVLAIWAVATPLLASRVFTWEEQ